MLEHLSNQDLQSANDLSNYIVDSVQNHLVDEKFAKKIAKLCMLTKKMVSWIKSTPQYEFYCENKNKYNHDPELFHVVHEAYTQTLKLYEIASDFRALLPSDKQSFSKAMESIAFLANDYVMKLSQELGYEKEMIINGVIEK